MIHQKPWLWIVMSCLLSGLMMGCATQQYTPRPPATTTPGAVPTQAPSATPKHLFSLESFRYCDLPCWHGITPGVTTRDEAARIISKAYGWGGIARDTETTLYWISLVETGDVSRGSFQFNAGHRIDFMRLYLDHGTLTVGELIVALGAPEYVIVDVSLTGTGKCGPSAITFRDQKLAAGLRFTEKMLESQDVGVSSTDVVEDIEILSDEPFSPHNKWTDSWITPWEGYLNYCARGPQNP